MEQLDLSKYRSAEEAAVETKNKLEEIAQDIDQKKTEVSIDKDKEEGKYIVRWEGGPFNWATVLTGGEDLFAEQIPEVRKGKNKPQIIGFKNQNFDVQCKNRFSLVFYEI